MAECLLQPRWVPVILSVPVVFGLFYLVTALACAFFCSRSEGATAVVAIDENRQMRRLRNNRVITVKHPINK